MRGRGRGHRVYKESGKENIYREKVIKIDTGTPSDECQASKSLSSHSKSLTSKNNEQTESPYPEQQKDTNKENKSFYDQADTSSSNQQVSNELCQLTSTVEYHPQKYEKSNADQSSAVETATLLEKSDVQIESKDQAQVKGQVQANGQAETKEQDTPYADINENKTREIKTTQVSVKSDRFLVHEIEGYTIESECCAVKHVEQSCWRYEKDDKYGANLMRDAHRTCSFRVWGPYIETCNLIIYSEGNEKEFIMNKVEEKQDTFYCEINGGYEGLPYYYKLTSSWNDCYETEGHELIRRDPYARSAKFAGKECYVVDPCQRQWKPFKQIEWKKYVIYEMHIGSFYVEEGLSLFASASKKLQYIRDLGFTAIELMPVSEFGDIWGYDCILPCCIHSLYGTVDELRDLVDKAHELGLAVIFDIVIDRALGLYRWDGHGGDGRGIYYENDKIAVKKEEVKRLMTQAALTFAHEYNGDGLRIEGISSIPKDVIREICGHIRGMKRGIYIIGGCEMGEYLLSRGGGLDGIWIESCYYGAYEIFKESHRHNNLNATKYITHELGGCKNNHEGIICLLGSHEKCSDMDKHGRECGYFVRIYGGIANWHSRSKVRLSISMNLLARGIPMMFMGSERMIEATADGTSPMNWEQTNYSAHAILMISDLNKIREANEELIWNKDIEFCHEDHQNHILGYIKGKSLVVYNLGDKQWDNKSYQLLTNWNFGNSVFEIFNSQSELYGGWEESWNRGNIAINENKKISINMPKWSASIYQLVH